MATDDTGTQGWQLRDELAETLGDAYLLGRELGGGGMSRVFLAEERRFGRRVVVKVLSPELIADVSVERFRREIDLMARLQHPNIVPLLSAGEVGGLPFFIMPFVDGSSLRWRLYEGPAPDTAESLQLLRDVARALVYAHGRGIVHRDIKPDNVLVCDGAATVTDFGIAKALSRARARPDGADTLTSAGSSIGTPSYMAPEQASGDPAVDHRADIYSWGVLAYEMLSGRTPFTGRERHQILAAQLTEDPPPLATLPTLAAGVPPAVAALVMRCLARSPAQRPQSAAELVTALDTAASGRHVSLPRPRRAAPRRLVAAGALVLIIALAGAAATAASRGTLGRALAVGARGRAALHVDRVVVAPFDNETGDSTLDPLGNMAADWVTQGLSRTGVVEVVDARTALLDAKIVDNTPWLLRRNGRVKALADESGAGSVVWGRYYRDGDSLRFDVRITDAASGRLVRAVDPVTGSARAPAQLVERLRERTMAALAMVVDTGSTWNVAMSQPPDYHAYQEAVAGFESYVRFDTAATMRHLRRASALDTGYVLPPLLTAFAYADMGTEAADPRLLVLADSALRAARAREARMSPGDVALADFVAAELAGDAESVLRAAKALMRLTPGSASPVLAARAALNANRPAEAVTILAAVPPNRGILLFAPIYWYTLGDARHALGDYREELDAAGRARRQFADISGVRAMPVPALAALGRADECARVVEESAGLRALRSVTASLASRRYAAAMELRAHGQPEAARRLLATLVGDAPVAESDEQRRERLALRARALYALERWTDADAAAAELRRLRPEAIEWRAMPGLVAARLGDRERASRVSAELAAASYPYYFGAEASLYRARIAALLGDREGAVALLRTALAGGAAQRGVHLLVMTSDFDSLRNYPPFLDTVRPKG